MTKDFLWGIIFRHAKAYAALAQLDRVFGYEPKGRGFESLTPCQQKEVDESPPLFVAANQGIRSRFVFKILYIFALFIEKSVFWCYNVYNR